MLLARTANQSRRKTRCCNGAQGETLTAAEGEVRVPSRMVGPQSDRKSISSITIFDNGLAEAGGRIDLG